MSDKCHELNAIKYKSMLQNKTVWSETKASTDLTSLDQYLESEKNINVGEQWSKMDKTNKIRKLTNFAQKYASANNLTEEEHMRLNIFFKDCLDKKKLCRTKDVNYDKETGEIKSIPALIHNKPTSHFTLKNIDKRVSTLKGLAPPKKTVKNIS